MRKSEWYEKLLLKLNKIKSGEWILDDYIKEVEEKLKKPYDFLPKDGYIYLKYSILDSKLEEFNQKFGTGYKIIHNGLEFCVLMTNNKNFDALVIKVIDSCGFNTPNYYGFKNVVHLLWKKEKQ